MMDLFDTSLRRVLDEKKTLDDGWIAESELKRMCKDILSALCYLHNEANIAHRDLKVTNIFFFLILPNSDLFHRQRTF